MTKSGLKRQVYIVNGESLALRWGAGSRSEKLLYVGPGMGDHLDLLPDTQFNSAWPSLRG